MEKLRKRRVKKGILSFWITSQGDSLEMATFPKILRKVQKQLGTTLNLKSINFRYSMSTQAVIRAQQLSDPQLRAREISNTAAFQGHTEEILENVYARSFGESDINQHQRIQNNSIDLQLSQNQNISAHYNSTMDKEEYHPFIDRLRKQMNSKTLLTFKVMQ